MQGLRNARVAKGLTQTQLAKAIGISQANLSFLETADVYPGEMMLAKINQTLGYGTGTSLPSGTYKGGAKVKQKQTEMVYDYMKKHGGISQRDAVGFGCYRLSARIHDLRKEGHVIKSTNKGFSGEFGSGHYAVYSLAE